MVNALWGGGNYNKELIISAVFFVILSLKQLTKILYATESYLWWGNQSIPYICSYKDVGFASRILLGFFIRLFKSYITVVDIWMFCFVSNIIFNILFSCILYLLLNKNKDNKFLYKIILFLSTLFVIYPFSTVVSGGQFAFTDAFLLFFTLISILMINKLKIKYVFLAIIPMIVAIGIHTVSFFLYFPAILIVLLYRFYRENYNLKKQIIYTILFFIPSFLLMITFMFFKNLSFHDEYEMLEYVNGVSDICYYLNKTDMLNFIKYEYFSNSKENYLANRLALTRANIVYLSLLHICVIMFLSCFYKIYRFSYKKDGNKKFMYILSMILPLAIIPLYIGCDFKRWTDGAIICQFIILFNYIYYNDDTVVSYFYNIRNEDFTYIIFLIFVILINTFGIRTELTNVVYNRSLEHMFHIFVMTIKSIF